MDGKRPTFRDIVAEVEQAPSTTPVLPPGLTADGDLVDLRGRVFRLYESGTTPPRALAAVQRGAQVAWNSCGCWDVVCGLSWYDRAARRRLATSQPVLRPTKHRRSSIDLWTDDHTILVVANEHVEWADLMA